MIDLTQLSNWFARIKKEVKNFRLSLDIQDNCLNIKTKFTTYSDISMGSMYSIPLSSSNRIDSCEISRALQIIENSINLIRLN